MVIHLDQAAQDVLLGHLENIQAFGKLLPHEQRLYEALQVAKAAAHSDSEAQDQ